MKKSDETADEADDEKEKARIALPVVTVNDRTITIATIEKIVSQMTPMQVGDLKDPARMEKFIDRLVKTDLMAEEAKRRGFDKDDEVTSIYKNKLASLMHRRIVEESDKAEPAEEDLKKYYDEHYDDYHKPEKTRARHILIKDKAKAEETLKKALGEKIKQPDFRKLAKERTENENTKKQGGDLGFFTRVADRKEDDKQIDPALVEAAFGLKANGDVHPKLIKTDEGYHILMRTGHRKKMDFSFEESKDRLTILVKREMRKKTVEEKMEKLKERYPVDVSEENLKHVVIELADKSTGKEGRRSRPPRGARGIPRAPK